MRRRSRSAGLHLSCHVLEFDYQRVIEDRHGILLDWRNRFRTIRPLGEDDRPRRQRGASSVLRCFDAALHTARGAIPSTTGTSPRKRAGLLDAMMRAMKFPSRLILTAGLGALALAAGTASSSAQFIFQPLTEATSKDSKIYISQSTLSLQSNLNVVSADVTHFLSLVQFDLSSLPLLASEITSATLTLYSTGLGASGGSTIGGDVTLSPILNAWRENAGDAGTAPLSTYDAFYGTTPTLTAGSAVATQTVNGAGFVTWDITNTVKAWVDGSLVNNGLLIQLATPGGDVGFADVDSNGAANAPKLTVVPEPSTAALLGGAGLLGLLRRRRNATAS
jgi:hypothetical protein